MSDIKAVSIVIPSYKRAGAVTRLNAQISDNVYQPESQKKHIS